MTKIANKAKCNIIESGYKDSGTFLGDLLVCPTYEEIINIDKFNVSGTYENNQLVKESDIAKYTGKTKNYSYIWGEWDLNRKSGQQIPMNYTYLNLRIRQNFLKAPDTNLKITIFLELSYRNTNSDPYTTVTKTLTANFTQATGNDKIYAYTQDFAVKFGNTTTAQFDSVTITGVSIEPTGGTSQYEYITNIKDITQNYFVNIFSVASTSFYIDSYNDDGFEKNISSICRIVPEFNIPSGTSINDITVGIEDFNYSQGESNSINYDTSSSSINYEFTAVDYYGERGYKLPYFYTKFIIKNVNNYSSYVYALWEPNSTNTGIELSSLILEE